MNLNEAKQILKKNGYVLCERSYTTPYRCVNDDIELSFNGKDYRVDVDASAEMYSSPGDRWSPPESSFEITDVTATWYELSGENNEIETKVEETPEMAEFLRNFLNDDSDYYFEEDGDGPYEQED